ncbi:Na/Pi cotransporter family protein [Hydrogenoanaerobacterium sp.]|uniref:Na/Pi cotransporter family protein n=1 Tax=Hydrogenoanaerobacterium sp. TaxID=2953763 RepID=UPI00289FDBC5|nr:Na/Pi cotransporter family protein [Hydrogenoanaerobacterium sp.]
MTFGFFGVVNLLGGLALFLYGMNLLGSGLEKLSGGRMEKTLQKLTNNVVKSVLLGALVTAAVQSSSATTVIVVGLVNAGILKLRQAIGVIMGANIGTTITAHILRLSDLDSSNFFIQLLKPTSLAPMIAIVGIVLLMTSKKASKKDWGQILIGFGILFTGMFNMEAAVRPLSDLPQFAEMFATLSNPIVGVLVGALVTAIIQSSSASVGILQALSSTGIITCSAAFPIIMGQNIGTCITPMLASIGANKNAKRTAMVHLYFNLIGTAIFLVATYSIQYTIGFSFWDQPIGRGGIANFHTIFNITVTLLFMPFTRLLEKLACWTVRSKQGDASEDEVNILDERFMVSPGLAINQARNTVIHMAKLARKNFNECCTLFHKFDAKTVERIKENENLIDKMEDLLYPYMLKLAEHELTEPESRQVSELLQLESEFERIGDYTINILECAQSLYEKNISFSDKALKELDVINSAVSEIIGIAADATETHDLRKTLDIEPLEENIDLMEETLKTRHIDRLKQGLCSVDAAFPFVETLANLERISDHCSNVGVYLISHEGEKRNLDRHEYIRKIHKGETEHYNEKFAFYEDKYYSKIK